MPAETLSVTELNREARRLLERHFPLLWVSGEISNLTRASSGHLYFSLKDTLAQVRCAMFRSRAQRLSWQLENGQQVEVQALITLYEARGDFQLNVEGMRRAALGMGRLYELFMRLREKLAGEGLFDTAIKRALPRFPRRIGLVTSPQAAALRDVIAALERRAPHVELIVYPCLVQGAEAPAALVAALQAAYARAECDLLLIVRGGGSIEDLWAFNDEAVARTVAMAPIPTICGIGHETDTVIADYVADRRAATPTAAAELASAGWFEAAAELARLSDTLARHMRLVLESAMQAVDRLALRLIHPAQRLATDRQHLELLARRLHSAGRQRLNTGQAALASVQFRLVRVQPDMQPAHRHIDRMTHRLRQAMHGLIIRQHDHLAHCSGALAALSPAATLQRGYSIVRSAAGHIVRDAAQLAVGDTLNVRFAHGEAAATVEKVHPDKKL